jgi:hypothetical protein
MRGLKRDGTARVIIRGHAMMQKPPTRALRTRHRRPTSSTRRDCVHGTRTNHLTGVRDRSSSSRVTIHINATEPQQAGASPVA